MVAALLASGAVAPAARARPVVVEAPGETAAAGVEPGDTLRGPAGASKTWDSPFDVEQAQLEAGARGPSRVTLARAGSRLTVELPEGEWGLVTRPELAAGDAQVFEEGQRHVAAGRLAEGAREWRALAADLAARARRRDAAWVLSRLAAAQATKSPAEARATLDAARAALSVRDFAARAALWTREGDLLAGPDSPGALAAYEQAVALRRRAPGAPLALAASLHHLARFLGLSHSRPDRALKHWRECEALRRRHAPASLALALASNGVGTALHALGDFEAAERRYRAALRLARARAPHGVEVARLHVNLGMLARLRRDFDAADEQLAGAVAQLERLGRDPVALANALNSSALAARDRGDLERAEDLFGRALSIFEGQRPDGVEVAGVLNNLGMLAVLREDWTEARRYHERALALREARGRERLDVAASLNNLGRVARLQGRLDDAETLLRRALALKEAIAPESPTVASTLEELALTWLARGDPVRAVERARRSVSLREPLDNDELATALSVLARALRAADRADEAVAANLRALDVIDGQRARPSGDGAQVGLSSRFEDLYRDTAVMLAELGRAAEALAVLERGRARALLGLLAQRDLLFRELPPALARERRRLAADYDREQAALSRLSPSREPADVERQRARLRALAAERSRLDARLRARAPRVADLQARRPLDLRGLRAALDPGTALVAFNVQQAATQVYVVRAERDAPAPGLSLHTLAQGERELRDRVRALRGFVERGQAGGALEPPLLGQAARLYADLLGPVEAELAGARRLLIVPDGPLHALPFAALVRRREPLQFLVEWRPLHTALSGTLYAQLLDWRSRPRAGGPLLAAFGAPLYPRAEREPAGDAAPVVARARGLAPLPASADEVRAIAALFPGQARTFLGARAGEARVRSLPRDTRYVHFALHALIDPRAPLDSALAFAPPTEAQPALDNGLLQAWEIFESVRLDAELVTLSACQTGLGREVGGEGLLGLVRAFHYAGARSVLASLWSVSDRSTAELMRAFYAQLKRGVSKDEALRQAQLELLRQGDARAHPFHWAAFQLSGDWR